MTSVVFFGSSEYSVIILEKLLNLPDFNLVSVITKTDKPVNRDQKITANPVAQFAVTHRLLLLQIDTFSPLVVSRIASVKPDLGLCVAFGPPFFEQTLIDLFPKKIINIHPSPLPKYRGATPGPWQIINGETTSAVTFFQIDSLPDHGPVISQYPFTIAPSETSASFYQKAFSLAAANLDSALNSYLSNAKPLTPQDHPKKSYFPKLTKDLALINWSWDAARTDRFIRAMQPWPVAWTYITDKNGQKHKMKIISADFTSNKLEIKKVQIEGKIATLWSEIEKYYSLVK